MLILLVPVLEGAGRLPFGALLILLAARTLVDAPGSAARLALLDPLMHRAAMRPKSANATFSAAQRVALIVGPPCAALLAAMSSPVAVLYVDAATFVVSAVLVGVFLRGVPAAPHTAGMPGAELDLLLAGGEGPTVEFKQEVPTDNASRKKVIKTVAAFASGNGGTVLFGVADNAQVIGIEPTARDTLMLAVGNMIRSNTEPEPPYTQRTVEWRGKMVLLVEVSAGGRWYAISPAKPEFYVRRGASTVPARLEEIASEFGQSQLGQGHPAP